MGYASATDFLPMWSVFPVTVGLMLLAIECGYRLGRHRRKLTQNEDRPPLGEMVTATLGLVAFLLAFTFGLAATRYDIRRGLVVEEANAIGTTYLRAALLPEPQRGDVRSLLRSYVDVRLDATRPGKLIEDIRRSEELHVQLWERAVVVGESQPRSIVVGLFIESLNQTIDLHTKRVALGAGNRIPATIWAALFFVAIVGTALLGYHTGLAGAARSLAIIAMVFAFSAVITLIADLDRPREGFLKVGQQAMTDLRTTMSRPGP